MDFSEALPFLSSHHQAVITTVRPSGQPHASIVVAGPMDGQMAFVVRGSTVKLRNLLNNPRCTVAVVTPEWRTWVAVEGTATLHTWDGGDPEQQRSLLRAAFTAAGGSHDDWNEYDRVMREERRAVILVQPERVYGRV